MISLETLRVIGLVAYSIFAIAEILRPREVRLLWGATISSVMVFVSSLFVNQDASYWSATVSNCIWFTLVILYVGRLVRQITMIPSTYGLQLSNRAYEKALKRAATAKFKGSLSPSQPVWVDEDEDDFR